MNGQSPTKQIPDLCVKDAWVWVRCARCDQDKKIQIKCTLEEMRSGLCQHCKSLRKRRIVAKALSRYDLVKNPSDKIVMWTFGTSLRDNERNRAKIVGMWKKFVRRLRYYVIRINSQFDPLMNVLEAGSKGDRLHYHVVARNSLPHHLALKIWRSITKEKSNVNFSKSFRRSAHRSFAYLAKYASKGYKYYWMGSMHSLKVEKFHSSDGNGTCNHLWEFCGIYQSGYRTQLQLPLQQFIE